MVCKINPSKTGCKLTSSFKTCDCIIILVNGIDNCVVKFVICISGPVLCFLFFGGKVKTYLKLKDITFQTPLDI